MYFMNKWIPFFLVVIGAALAEPPAPNYLHSNYDYQKASSRGSYGNDDRYSNDGGSGTSDDGYQGESEGGGDYGSADEGGQGHGESYSNAPPPAPQGDDFGYNELSPEKPYSGPPQDHMTHTYSPPTHYNGAPGGYRRPGGIRLRMPALIKNMFRRRRPQKMHMVAHSAPSYSSFGSSHASPYSNDVASASYGGPHTSSVSTSNYGGPSSSSYESGPSSSSYGGPSSSSYGGHSSSSYIGGLSNSYDSPSSSYGGGSGKYNKPPKYYEGHLSARPAARPVKPYSSPSETSYGQYPPVKSHGAPSKPYKEVVKPPRKGYSAPPPANQYGAAMKGHNSPDIANSYGGGIGDGHVEPTSSYAGRPSKGHRNKPYRPSQPDYESGYNNGNRNSGHDYAQPDVYGGGFDRGTSHY